LILKPDMSDLMTNEQKWVRDETLTVFIFNLPVQGVAIYGMYLQYGWLAGLSTAAAFPVIVFRVCQFIFLCGMRFHKAFVARCVGVGDADKTNATVHGVL